MPIRSGSHCFSPATQWMAFRMSVVWSIGSTTSRTSFTSAISLPSFFSGLSAGDQAASRCCPSRGSRRRRPDSRPGRRRWRRAASAAAVPPQPWLMTIVGSFSPSELFGAKTSAAMRVPSLMMSAVRKVTSSGT